MIHSTSPWMVLLARLKLLPKLHLLSLLHRLDLLDLVDLLPMLKLLAKLHFLSKLDLPYLSPASTLSVPASSLRASLSCRLSSVAKISIWDSFVSFSSVMDGWSLDVTSLCSGVTNENDTLLFAMVFGLGFRFEVVEMAVLDIVVLSVPVFRVLFSIYISMSRTSSFQLPFKTGGVIGTDFYDGVRESSFSLS